jgi:uncharacterized protein YjiS (DUF1127 family)
MITEAFMRGNRIISNFISFGGRVMSLSRSLAALYRFLSACAADARSRRALLTLDDRLLRDIGITRAEARRAAERPLWMRTRSRMGGEFPDRRHARPSVRKAPAG